MKRLAAAILAAIALVAIFAPVVAPHAPGARFPDHPHAPPTRLRVVHEGALGAPFFYPQRLTDRLEERYEEDRTQPIAVEWFAGGRLVAEPAGAPPLLLAGADGSGRDVFARAIYGARVSLGIGVLAVTGAALLGLLIGGLAGARGGWFETVVMRAADVGAVLPAIYIVVALRSALPLVLPVSTTIAIVIAILALVGTPWVARGVRVDRRRRTGVGLRRSRARRRRLAMARARASPAAGDARVRRHAGHAALPCHRRRGGHAEFCRSRPARHGAQLGHGAAGDGQRRRARRLPVDPAAGAWRLSRHLVAECVSL